MDVQLSYVQLSYGSDPLATQQAGYGTITIVFNHGNEAVLTYGFPSVGLAGEMVLSRVVLDNVGLCEVLKDG